MGASKENVVLNKAAFVKCAENQGLASDKVNALKKCHDFVLGLGERFVLLSSQPADEAVKNAGQVLSDEDESCGVVIGDEVYIVNFAWVEGELITHSIERAVSVSETIRVDA